jgi:hypothetical protein
MPVVRPWLVIPAVAVAAGAVAGVVSHVPIVAVVAALLGAALAAAIRAFVGADGPATVAVAAGAALGVLGWLELGGGARAAMAGAAAMFAICELALAKDPTASRWPAVVAAGVAGVLDPAYAALVAIAGAQLVAMPAARARWTIALPIAGVAMALVAVLAAFAHHGTLAQLELAWAGHAPGHGVAIATLGRAGDLLGPLTSVAALAGLALCAARGRMTAVAVVAVVAFTALATLGNVAVDPATPIVAALGAGVALGRIAALVRLPVGKTFVAATAGFVLVAVPAWTLAVSG